MGKPNKVVDKKRGGAAKVDLQRRKKSFYKYKKLLRKESINSSQEISAEEKRRELPPGMAPKGSKGRVGNTNSLLQTYGKVKSKKEDGTETEKKRQERFKVRQDKMNKKRIRNMKLSKLTKKGQPVMKNKMELLLEKIMDDKETYSV